MKIVNTESLPDFEYIKIEQPKSQIVLHHTVSEVGKYIDDWFKADKGKSRIAVAFVVDKDGTVFKLFEPKYWAYHIGGSATADHNKHSIGIEVVNEGPLYKRNTGKFYWWMDKQYPQGRYLYKYKVYDLGYMWRDSRYYASYTEQQYEAVINLIHVLLHTFRIKKNFINHFHYDRSLLDYEGVVMHCNLRRDKTDLSMAYNIDKLNSGIKEGIDASVRGFEEIPLSLFDVKSIELNEVTYDMVK